jgi:TRAP-type C4-dicarboxylate transport system substrate-binding protein
MVRRLVAIFAAAACLGTVPGIATDARADERRIATLAPEGSLWLEDMERGATEIRKLTKGRITVKFYAGGSQGDERDVIRKMRLEQLDGAALTSIGLGMIYPGIRVLELPFLWESVDEIDYVRKKMWPYFEEKFAEEGFTLLAAGDVGWVHLFSANPIESVDDLEAARMWAWTDDPIVRKLFKLMKLDGVPLGVPAVLAGLQSGRIDACYGSPLAAVALQWHTQVNYMSDEPVGYGLAGMVMRTDVWESASAEDREIQVDVGRKRMRKSIERIRRDNKRALKAMLKNGMKVLELPPEFETELRKQALALREKMAGDLYTQAELDMVLEYRDEYRAKQGENRKVARGVTAE